MLDSNHRILLNSKQLDLIIKRLSHQLLEEHNDFENSVLIGLQPRGKLLAQKIHTYLLQLSEVDDVPLGFLDVSFYRDDFRRREDPIQVNETKLDFEIENKKVILVDDVLFTGRTVRAGMDALMDYGRPLSVEFVALIDRRFSRQIPVHADYIGCTVDSVAAEHVDVRLEGAGEVILNTVADEK